MKHAKPIIAVAAATAMAAGAVLPVAAQSADTGQGHMMVLPEQLQWKPAPSVGPGAQIAVIEGPLDEEKPFTFRLKMPAGMKVAPHVHPAYERVTVLSGTFHFAHGASFDRKKTTALTPGSVAIMPAGAPMFGYTEEETVVQLHGTGPWGIRYLNPEDDPRRNDQG